MRWFVVGLLAASLSIGGLRLAATQPAAPGASVTSGVLAGAHPPVEAAPGIAPAPAAPVGAPPGGESLLEKAQRAQRLYKQAQQAWEQWEPQVSEMATRLREEYRKHNQWEYEALSTRKLDSQALVAQLNAKGAAGWECFAAVELSDGPHLLLRKRRASALTQFPMRELFEVILFKLLVPDFQS